MRGAIRTALFGLALAASITPVAAQQAPAPVTALDSARIAAARPMVDKLFPVGTYKRMMGETMSKMMGGMMGSMMKMPVAQLARISGLPVEKLAGMNETSLEQVAAIVDPHFRERTTLGMDAMMGAMADMMDGFEPNIRNALTRAYARKFDVRQLGEINLFFGTPTGNRFASEYMTMMMDPDVMGEMQALMPQIMKAMPALAARAKKATESLPPPRKLSDLSPAEQDRLAQLLGIKANELKDSLGREGSK